MKDCKMDLVTICIIVIAVLTSNIATLFFGCTFLVSKFKRDVLLEVIKIDEKSVYISPRKDTDFEINDFDGNVTRYKNTDNKRYFLIIEKPKARN